MVFNKGDGCQLFAELLQHDHPLQQGHVVDAAEKIRKTSRRGEEHLLKKVSAQQMRMQNHAGSTYVMPSGSRPNNLFLTSSSLDVKSGIRWILNMRSPTT